MTPEIERLRRRKRSTSRLIERNRSAIERSQRKEAEYERTLRESQAALEEARRVLRKAKLLQPES